MQSIDLSIIIVNYNTKSLLIECVKSVLKHKNNLSLQIIVVDNASSDGSVEALSKKFKKGVVIISNKENKGFAKANNQGIAISKGKYILLLNSDTKITSSVLSQMIDFMEQNKSIGIASCSLFNPDGSLQFNGGYYPTLPRIFMWMFFLNKFSLLNSIIFPFHSISQESKEQDWVTGAFFIIRREVVEKIGMLDEDYFMYTEDLDFCYRAKKEGFGVFLRSEGGIIHYGGASSESSYPLTSELQNIQIFYKKHYPSWQRPFLILFLKAGVLIRMMGWGLLLNTTKAKIYAEIFRKI